MKSMHKALAGLFTATLLSLVFAPNSIAQCGSFHPPLPTRSSWHPQLGQPHLLRAAFVTANGHNPFDDDFSIVGFWHVKFISDGVTTGIPGGIPKGAEVDAGYSQWHRDGTEILNSAGRAPNTSSFCLGVWEQTGPRKYVLNHFAAAWDPTKGAVGPAGPAGELIGPANIREEVTLSPNGDSFEGTFTIDNYNESDNLLSHLQGTITGTRINVNTAPSSIF
jgi:hypothetical protein